MLGMVFGIASSIAAWMAVTVALRPKLETRGTIERRVNRQSRLRFRAAYRNAGRRDLLEIRVTFYIRIRGLVGPATWTLIYIPVDDEVLPRLLGRGRPFARRTRSVRWQYPVLQLDQLRPSDVSCLPQDVQDLHNRRDLKLDDLMSLGDEAEAILTVVATDSFSGVRRPFVRRYSTADIASDAIPM